MTDHWIIYVGAVLCCFVAYVVGWNRGATGALDRLEEVARLQQLQRQAEAEREEEEDWG